MSTEIDFSSEKINRLKMYGGKNGGKICIVYCGENYMLKFPPKPTRNPNTSYTNSCISEHVACRVFETLGMEAQSTLLGRYGGKIAVACKDFEADGFLLKDFAQLKNTVIDSSQNGYGTELSDVLATIREQQIISPVKLEEFFWNMFVGDALLGNFDRHNGNWGFLINEGTSEVKIAPIFDCGSCLYPQLEENGMRRVLGSREEIEERLFEFPNSALQQDGIKINYATFLMNTEHLGCLKAVELIGNRVDLHVIDSIVDDTPYISDTHKVFLKTMIKERKMHIIDRAKVRIKCS
ncbi:MAG: HipA domain-containing protein [Oscillospiraceae bacterium]|jgi:hypothetical protein|nr:HipA domain-containing protein [Oscillospiraceae bacterium]